ncbi:MAG TPA: hypothetical protein VN688_12575 [Gemmataceae bacterium]|nr:hypothetical protein [Gemmataceae bacterium]
MAKKQVETDQPVEKLTNKAEAVRRALGELGDDAMPTEIQQFIKARFDVEMTTKVISVYKSKRAKKKSKGDRKSAVEQPLAEGNVQDAISLRDLRSLKELKERHGSSRLQELLQLVSP